MPAARFWLAVLAVGLVVPTGALITRPASAAEPGRLTGTVTDDDGARLHGASVRLLDGSGGVVAQANAGADGRYQLAAPQASYRLVVTHAHEGGWLKAQVGNVTVGSASELDVVAVAPPVHLRARVDVGELAGSSVVVSLVGNDHTYSASAPTDGAFDVAVEPGRYRLKVTVNLPWAWESDGSLWVESVDTLDVTGDRTIDLRLPVTWVRIGTPDTGGALRPGQSIDISSGPVPSPAVSIGAGLTATPSFKTSGVTDSSGFARIPALPTPALDASFSPPAKNPDHYEADLVELSYSIGGIDARAAETEVRFDPKPLVSLAGRFTDGAGNSLGDGYVELSGPNGVAETFIKADGSFTTRVPTGRYSVKLTGRRAYGFVKLSLPDVDLTANRVTTFQLPLHASTVLVRGAGDPVADATLLGGTGNGETAPAWAAVATEYPGSTARVQLNPLRTDLSGRATLVAPTGVPLTVSVRPPTGLNLGPVMAVVAADATSTTVRLPAGGTVSGRLGSTLGHGHPAVGVTVTDNPAILPAYTTSDGTFSLQAAPGPARLTLRQGTPATDSNSDLPDHWSLAGNVMLDPGQPLDLLLSSPSTDLRFVDGDGKPLPVRAVASADVSGVVTGAGLFAGQTESHTRCCTPSDRLSVRSFGGATGSVHVGTQDGTVQPHSWMRATGVPFPTGGRVTLAVATPTSDPGGAIRPSSTTTTTTTRPPSPADPPPGAATTTTTIAPPAGTKATLPPGSGRSGYWMVTTAGAVHTFGEAKHYGEPARSLGAARAVRLEPTPTGRGYWMLDDRGVVHAYGDATHHGDVNRARLAGGETPTSLSGTPTGKGYWVFTTRGRVLSFGDAAFYGDVSSLTLNGPVLGSVATPTGRGYYMVASDGGIFTFGDARFHGSTGNLKLNKPVMGMAPSGDGSGYWLVASDGGIFAFGVPFHGSMGAVRLNKPISGIVPGRGGYLMVAQDGGIFSFGQVAFHGSLGATPPPSPVVSAALLP